MDTNTETKATSLEFVTNFDIPEDVAKRLSDLLVKQNIREKICAQVASTNPAAYEETEKLLIPIVTEVEALKATITKEYVPDEYASSAYMWNYDGYAIAGTNVSVYKVIQ